MHVASILSAKGVEVALATPDTTTREAVARLRDRGIGALVVSSDGRRIDGIVSERDVVRCLAEVGAAVLDQPVSDLMSTEVLTCSPADRIDALMALMTEERVRHLPVVDDDGLLAGIISIGDVVKHRVGELEREQAQLIDYVRSGR